MSRTIFKEGDRIQMLSTCGDQEKGEILTVRKHPNDPHTLYVRHKNEVYDRHKHNNLCSCKNNWKLLSKRITNWKSEVNK